MNRIKDLTRKKADDCFRKRNKSIIKATTPLPGSIPYVNRRPMKVRKKYSGLSVSDFLLQYHPHMPYEYWIDRINRGFLVVNQRSVEANTPVFSGDRLTHIIPETVEPEVNPLFRFVYEDKALAVFEKSAPLPVHPCGRYNRNTMSMILKAAFPNEEFRIVHRLDANTTGVLVCAKTRDAARELAHQFSSRSVKKTYLAEVNGHPVEDDISCTDFIHREPSEAGTRVVYSGQGSPSRTDCYVLERSVKNTSLLKVIPHSGRTNQIRIHLSQLGYGIIGDNAYGLNKDLTGGFSNYTPLHLHAWKLELTHPLTNQRVLFVADPPVWANSIYEK